MVKNRAIAIIVAMLMILSTIQINVFAETVEDLEEAILPTVDVEIAEIIDIGIETDLQDIEDIFEETDNLEITYEKDIVEQEEVKESRGSEEEQLQVVEEIGLKEQPLEEDVLEKKSIEETIDTTISPKNIKVPLNIQVNDKEYSEITKMGYVVENLSEYPVLIKGIYITSVDGWELSNFNKDYKNVGFNKKLYALRVENHNVNNDYLKLDIENIIIEPESIEVMDIELKLAKQLNGINEVIFKIKVDLESIIPETPLVEEQLLDEDIIQEIEQPLEEVIEELNEDNTEETVEDVIEEPIEDKLDASPYYETLDYLSPKVNDAIDYLTQREVITQQAAKYYSKEIKDYKVIFRIAKSDIERVSERFNEDDLIKINKAVSDLEHLISYMDWLVVSTLVGEEVFKEIEGVIEQPEQPGIPTEEDLIDVDTFDSEEQKNPGIEGIATEEDELEEVIIEELEELEEEQVPIQTPIEVNEEILEQDEEVDKEKIIGSEIKVVEEEQSSPKEELDEEFLIEETYEVEEQEQSSEIEKEVLENMESEISIKIEKFKVREVIKYEETEVVEEQNEKEEFIYNEEVFLEPKEEIIFKYDG